MLQLLNRRWPYAVTLFMGAAALLLVAGIVRSPEEAFRASLAGLELWWNVVFPGLLPPLILAELLAAAGLLHGLAALCEPLTRRWLRLPGAAGWAIALGWSGGIPSGARETARLHASGRIRTEELDTVLLVAHMPNLFLIVIVIGGGWLQAPVLGWAIAGGLWLSVLLAGGIWSRLFLARARAASPAAARGASAAARALRSMAAARREDGRPFGQQLADAVSRSVTLLLTIGGLILMSAVAVRMLQLAFPGADLWLAVSGAFEMHIGAYETSRSALLAAQPAALASLLAAWLAWSGFSGLLQARAAFGQTAFPWRRVLAGRLLHAALALGCTYPLALWLERSGLSQATPAGLFGFEPATAGPTGWLPDGWPDIAAGLLVNLGCLAVFALLALLSALIRPGRRR